MQQPEEKSGNFLALTTTVFMLSTAVLGYMMFETYFNKVTVSKSQFICTKIEQVGKHMMMLSALSTLIRSIQKKQLH